MQYSNYPYNNGQYGPNGPNARMQMNPNMGPGMGPGPMGQGPQVGAVKTSGGPVRRTPYPSNPQVYMHNKRMANPQV